MFLRRNSAVFCGSASSPIPSRYSQAIWSEFSIRVGSGSVMNQKHSSGFIVPFCSSFERALPEQPSEMMSRYSISATNTGRFAEGHFPSSPTKFRRLLNSRARNIAKNLGGMSLSCCPAPSMGCCHGSTRRPTSHATSGTRATASLISVVRPAYRLHGNELEGKGQEASGNLS